MLKMKKKKSTNCNNELQLHKFVNILGENNGS